MNYSKAWANNELHKLLTQFEHKLHLHQPIRFNVPAVELDSPMAVVSEQRYDSDSYGSLI